MRDEEFFYKELARVPAVPENAIVNIRKKIDYQHYKKHALYGIAASLLLTIGTLTFFTYKSHQEIVIQPEIADELQIARDFINLDDIETDYNQYTLVEATDY